MTKNKIGVVVAVDGEKQYTQAMINIGNSLKTTKSESAKVKAEFEGQRNTVKALTAVQEVLARKLEEQKQKQEAASNGLKHANENYSSATKRLEELKRALEDAKKKQEEMKNSGTASDKELKSQEKTVEDYAKAVGRQESELTRCDGKIKSWQQKLNTADRELIETNRELNKNAVYLKEAEDATDGCAKSIDGFGKKVDGISIGMKEGIMAGIGSGIVQAGTGALKKIGQEAVQAGKYVIDVGSSFEAAMSEVKAISGATGEEFSKMEEKAKELGSSTKFSATEVAEGFKYMSLAGWSTSDMISGIDGVLNLAAASGMELASASDMLTDYLSAFGMQASQSAYMADMLACAQANSNTTAEQLGEAYQNCAANMNSAGQDIETTTSLLEAMANQGTKGSKAGTQLSAIMRDITAKMKDGKIAIGDTSVKVTDANGNFRDLTDILTDVEKATDGMGNSEKNAALKTTFTADSINGLNLILNEGVGKISGYETALRNSSGAAQEMADTMNDNLKGDMTEAESELEGLGIAAYEYIEGPVRGVVQGVTGFIQGITEVIAPQKTEFDNFVDSIQTANDELEKSIENADAAMENANLEASKIETLGTQLMALNGVEDKSLAQKYQLKEIVSQLGETIPEIASAYDEETGKVKLTDEAIQRLISSTKDLMIAQAAQNAMQEVTNQLVNAEIALENANMAKDAAADKKAMYEEEKQLLLDLQEEYGRYQLGMAEAMDVDAITEMENRYVAFWNEMKNSGRATIEEYNAAMENAGLDQLGNRLAKNENDLAQWDDTLSDATNTVRELKGNVEEANEKVDAGNKVIETVENRLKGQDTAAKSSEDSFARLAMGSARFAAESQNTTDAIADENKVLDENADAMEASAEAAKAGADAQKAAAQNIRDAYESARSEIESSLQNKISLSDMFDGGEDLTTEKMNENLQSQIEGIKNWKVNLIKLKEMTDENGTAIFSPEVIAELEKGGTEYANMISHMVYTAENQGEYGIEQLKGINDKWTDAMDLTEKIAETGAANRVAYEQATSELGSTDVEFSDLRDSIDTAVSSAAEGWKKLPEETKTALEETVEIAQECGVKIPDGLADGIANGSVSPESAMEQLNGSIQGTFDALAEVAKNSGISDKIISELSEGIQTGGQEAVDAITELADKISKVKPEIKTDDMQESIASGADEIANQTGAYTQAGEALGTAASEGLSESLSEDDGAVILNPDSISAKSGEYEKAGEALGEAVVRGLKAKQQEINDALSPGTDGITGKAGEYETAGATLGQAFASGLGNTEKDASIAGSIVAGAASKALTQKQREYQTGGQKSAQSYANAIIAGRGAASSAGGSLGSAAKSGVAAYQGAFHSVGSNISAGVASGISAGSSSAIRAAENMAESALAAAKRKLGIHSPSVRFRKDVGHQIANGMAFGIKDKSAVAGKAAAKMSAKVYTNATSWLAKYKKTHKTSLEDEKWYWQEVQKHVKKGSNAYIQAAQKVKQISLQQTGVSADLSAQIAKNFGVSSTTTTGSGKKKKTTKKSDATYYSEIYSAADKYLSNYQTIHKMSLASEKAYWVGVQKQLKKGTQGWYDAQKQINALNEEIEQEKRDRLATTASVQDAVLSKYKVYYKVSAKAEMDYWNAARKQFKAGTDERIEADQKYLEAMQEWYDQRKELDEDYLENSKKINDELADSVKDLQDTYKDAVAERKRDILSSMNLFDAWDASGYNADTLIYNLKTQVAGLALWEQQLEELGKKGLAPELMEELKEMGPEAAANIYSLNQMTAQQLDEYEKLWKQKNDLAQSQAVKENESLRQETNSEIIRLRTEAQAELNALNADYRAALQELNTGISGELSNLIKKAGSIGEEAVSGLIGGIGRAANSVDTYNSTTKVVSQVSSQLSALQQEGKVIGKNTLDGILEGLTDNAKISTAAQDAVNSIKRAMEEAAEIHSPSRLFKRAIGKQIPAGIGEGMKEGTAETVRTAQKMLQETIAAAQEEMQKRQQEMSAMAVLPDYSGVMRLNRMISHQPQAPVVNINNDGMISLLGELITAVKDLSEKVDHQQIVLDTGTMVGELQRPMSQENAAVMGRRRRLR